MSKILEEDQGTSSHSRDYMVAYLQSKIGSLDGEIGDAIKAAYDVAGLMSTKFAQSLDASDPIDEIFTIAGELESNPDNADELRHELIGKIKSLR